MTTHLSTICRCTVYDGTGEPCAESLDLDTQLDDEPSTSERVTLRRIMSRDVVCARSDLRVGAVMALMIERHVGCIPVVDDQRRPIGMITKFDIVELLEAFVRGGIGAENIAARTADEIMLPIAITLGEGASIATAAAMMATEDLHHVLVVNARARLVGIVSTKDITNWLVENVKV